MSMKKIALLVVPALIIGISAHAVDVWQYEAWGGFDPDPTKTTVNPFPTPGFQDYLAAGYEIGGILPARSLTWGVPLGSEGPFNGKSGAIVNWPAVATQYPDLDEIKSDGVIRGGFSLGVGGVSEPFLLAAITHINQPIQALTSPPTSWPSWGKSPFLYAFDIWKPGADTSVDAPVFSGEFPDQQLLFWESLNSINPGGTVNPPVLDPAYAGDPWTTISKTDDLFQVPLVNQTYLFSDLYMETFGWFEAPNLTGTPQDYFWTEEALQEGSTFLASATVTIPEPSTWAFIILGLGALAARRFRKS